MTLVSIKIENYRSIEKVEVDCAMQDDGSATFGLIGANEAGKSSILSAIALMNTGASVSPKGIRNKRLPVEVIFNYRVSETKFEQLSELVKVHFTDVEEGKYGREAISLICEFEPNTLERKLYIGLTEVTTGERMDYLVPAFPSGMLHQPIFWSASDKYLISQSIDLNAFASDPSNVSVPLRNCFLLANIPEIAERVAGIQGDSAEQAHLQKELGKAVTKHIQTVWPNHPIEISFLINSNQINFHANDAGTDTKPKTADQRSDGFKQFVSFLLTVSAQNQTEELSRSILLLDEPETHLHPVAQEHLLAELVKITANHRENLVFFATHSNYMIDKADLSRNFRVSKDKDVTEVARLKKKNSSYASVSYDVFSVLSTDFHNELFAKLHERYQDADQTDVKRSGLKNFDDAVFVKELKLKRNKPWMGQPNAVTLPTYLRNCIHHPDNGNKFTPGQLKESIELLKKECERVV